MSTSTTLNTKIFTDLPHPIATAWDRVLRSTSSADQVRQIKALLDVYLRYTSGILLAAYVREEPKDAIESMLPSFQSIQWPLLRFDSGDASRFREIQTERDASFLQPRHRLVLGGAVSKRRVKKPNVWIS